MIYQSEHDYYVSNDNDKQERKCSRHEVAEQLFKLQSTNIDGVRDLDLALAVEQSQYFAFAEEWSEVNRHCGRFSFFVCLLSFLHLPSAELHWWCAPTL